MIHRRLLQLAGFVTGPILAVTAIAVLISAAYVAQALLLAHALGAIVAGELTMAVVPLLWCTGVIAVRAALLWAREVLISRCGGIIRRRLRDTLVARLASLGPASAFRNRAGAATSAIVDGVEGLDGYFSRYLPQLLVVVVVPLTIAGGLLTISVPAATVLLVAVAAAVVVPRFWDARLLTSGRARWRAYEQLTTDYVEATQAIPTLRIFGAGMRVGAALEERSATLYRTTMAQLRLNLVEGGISALALHLGTALAVLVAAYGVVTENVPAAAVFVFLLCGRECFRPVTDLSTAWHAGYLGLNAVDGIDALMSARPDVPDDGTRDAPATAPAAVTFRRVSYRHPGGNGISDIGFELPAGSTIGLTGSSGAGKSTIAKLLERQFDPDAGVIELDGTPLTAFSLDALRASVFVVGQETYLFHGTVAENLRLARPNASDQDIRRSAYLADAADFISALPDGYATVLDEGGNRLSGGQRQRLAIARALVADRPVLILDEATSALDLETESRVLTRLATAAVNTTYLIIAHRQSALRDADRILQIDSGRMTDEVRV